jgi:RsmE family RNA methyltransferase
MNCILLPAANFSNESAHINAAAQIEHVNQVLGAKVGDTLKIGQLEGNLGSAVIADMMPERILLSNVSLTSAPPPKLDLTVVLALPRPKVLRRLIMDMTALGVRDIILINSYRTQKSYWQSPMLNRLDEFVLEGLQQGIDTIAPRISLQKRFKPFVEDELANLIINRAIVAHPYSALSFSQYVQQQLESSELPHRSVLPSMVFIGAEGGWIDYEVELLARQGCQAVHIGARILRTEAAVNAILGQWLL